MRPSDTSPEAQRSMDDHYRQMTPAAKLGMLGQAWEAAKTMALAGLRLDFPEATEDQLIELWAERRLGKRLYQLAHEFQQAPKQ